MPGQGSVPASAIGSRGCAAAGACLRADKNNKEGPWQEFKEECVACRWHCDAFASHACRLVRRSVEAASKAGITGGCDSRKIDRRLTLRKSERRQSQRLLH